MVYPSYPSTFNELPLGTNQDKIHAAPKKEAGGDAKHVCFFTWP